MYSNRSLCKPHLTVDDLHDQPWTVWRYNQWLWESMLSYLQDTSPHSISTNSADELCLRSANVATKKLVIERLKKFQTCRGRSCINMYLQLKQNFWQLTNQVRGQSSRMRFIYIAICCLHLHLNLHISRVVGDFICTLQARFQEE